MPTFQHQWDPDDYEHNALSATAPPPNALVRMSVDAEGGFWLEANREGLQFLAQFFAEMAGSNLEPGWHTHKSSEFEVSGGPPEFTFGVIGERDSAR